MDTPRERVPKQVIVMRKDLNMRKGKMCAQAAHAAMLFLQFEMCTTELNTHAYTDGFKLTFEEYEWLEGSHAKICVSVNSEAELLALHAQAKERGLTAHLVTDNGHTEFHGEKTLTCLAIGPHYPEAFEGLTSHLPLL